MSKLTKGVLFDTDVQSGITRGLKKAYKLAKASYGPSAGNALLEMPYGNPLLSRDGVTNLRSLYLEDPIENMAVRYVVEASEQNNRKVGDGTTATAILTYFLYMEARKLVVAGYNQMVVAKELEEIGREAIRQLDKLKKPVKSLEAVATTSSGDKAIGQMIGDILEDIGADGGITIEDFMGLGIQSEVVDGFYFSRGYTSVYLCKDMANLESRFTNIPILIIDKRLISMHDIGPILDKIVGEGHKELVIIGSVEGEALGVLVENRLQNKILTTVVDIPAMPGGSRALFLEDIAIVTSATVLSEAFNVEDFEMEMLGAAAKVVINGSSTAIIGSDGAEEDVEKRVLELREQQKEATHPTDIEAIAARLAALTGKIAIIRVGGAIEAEQKEIKLRVEDAVGATQAALKDGVLPGGGVALAKLNLEKYKEAFEEPFRQLVDNSGENPEKYLAKLTANKWFGFNLKDPTEKPIDLLKAGVLDSALVIKEVVQNAVSTASKLITTSSAVYLKNREEKHD